MVQNGDLNGILELNPTREANGVMEHNPSKKTGFC